MALSEFNQNISFQDWLDNENNVMYEEDGSVGLATFEYNGCYTVHWFFNEETRGRKALNLAGRMLGEIFNRGAQIVRGVTPEKLRGARWACRQIGMTSQGLMEFSNGPHEVFTMTKEEYNGRCR